MKSATLHALDHAGRPCAAPVPVPAPGTATAAYREAMRQLKAVGIAVLASPTRIIVLRDAKGAELARWFINAPVLADGGRR